MHNTDAIIQLVKVVVDDINKLKNYFNDDKSIIEKNDRSRLIESNHQKENLILTIKQHLEELIARCQSKTGSITERISVEFAKLDDTKKQSADELINKLYQSIESAMSALVVNQKIVHANLNSLQLLWKEITRQVDNNILYENPAKAK